MAILRKAVLATAIVSTGLLSTTGLALAAPHQDTDSTDGGATYQRGLVNSNDVSPNTNPALCNNDVPANVLGVQVPVQDVAGSLPILTKASDGASPSIAKGCSKPAAS